jgi:hypothetical protein
MTGIDRDAASRKSEDESMIDVSVQKDLTQQMEQLSPAMQRRVLDYARALAESTPEGVPGNQLLEFAGIMTPEEGDEFLRGIG